MDDGPVSFDDARLLQPPQPSRDGRGRGRTAAARTRLRPAAIAWIGRGCGAALIGLGVLQALR